MRSPSEESYDLIAVEELLRGVHEWQNIQDIVRITFKSLAEVVKTQGQTISELERQMPSKLSRSEFQSALLLKADAVKVSEQISELRMKQDSSSDMKENHDFSYFKNELRNLNSKIDKTRKLAKKEVDFVKENFNMKADVVDVEDVIRYTEEKLMNAIEQKINLCEVEDLLERKADIEDLQPLILSLETKPDFDNVDERIESFFSQQRSETDRIQDLVREFKQEIEKVVREYTKETENMYSRLENQLKDLQSHTSANLLRKLDPDQLEQKLGSLKTSLDQNLLNLRTDIENKIKAISFSDIEQKINDIETKFAKELTDKFQQSQELLQKNLRDYYIELNECQSSMKEHKQSTETQIETLSYDMLSHINESIDSVKSFARQQSKQYSDKLEEVEYSFKDTAKRTIDFRLKDYSWNFNLKSLEDSVESLKSSVETIEQDLILKASIHEICKLLDSRTEEINQDFITWKAEVANSLQTPTPPIITSEGRWSWSKLNGHIIIDSESFNTHPQNYSWSGPCVSVSSAGLYELTCGAFSRRRPIIQLFVNDEAVLSMERTPDKSEFFYTSIVAHSFSEYLALPARARLTLSQYGEGKVEGFLRIKKI